MKETFIKIETEIEATELKLQELKEAQAALQKLCDHDYQYTGSTHNDSVYQCTICNKVEYR